MREIVLPAVAASRSEIADVLGISRQTLYDILGERQAVTPAMAVRLAAAFGGSPELWLRMQTAHDLWHAMRAVDTTRIRRFDEVDVGA